MKKEKIYIFQYRSFERSGFQNICAFRERINAEKMLLSSQMQNPAGATSYDCYNISEVNIED